MAILTIPSEITPRDEHWGFQTGSDKHGNWLVILDADNDERLQLRGARAEDTMTEISRTWNGWLRTFPRAVQECMSWDEDSFRYYLDGILEGFVPDDEEDDDSNPDATYYHCTL